MLRGWCSSSSSSISIFQDWSFLLILDVDGFRLLSYFFIVYIMHSYLIYSIQDPFGDQCPVLTAQALLSLFCYSRYVGSVCNSSVTELFIKCLEV
jgi:hypothetical protein